MHAIRLTLFCLVLVAGPQALADEIDFDRDIRPILSDKCVHCHGPDEHSRETDLRFDDEESAKSDLGGYAAVVPGNPDASELFLRITSSDESDRMPPVDSDKQLTSSEIELLRRWIAEGAEWVPAWSYVPPVRHEPPKSSGKWGRNWIDGFILAQLQAAGTTPNEEADSVALIRRLSFDLVGLPPSDEMVARFVNDPSDETYAAIVDELLASRHYGERMAMYWLDLVRFADTVGYHGDQTHSIWPYRDYVIGAFNANLPFDQFTREQLAGDLLPDPAIDQTIATGYNRLLQTSHEGGVQLKEYRAIYLADRVRNVSQVWMGATVGCAQCHDHKYDPYTTRDFYSLGAFFADVEDEHHLRERDNLGGNKLPTSRSPEIEVLGYYQREKLAKLNREIESAKTSGAEAETIAKLEQQRQALAEDKSLTMVVEPAEPREVRILPRGNWLDETGDIVQPAVPEFLGNIGANGQRSTRLDLANWLTDADTGVGSLTARVMANRFWYLLFGEGLARVLDDFGGQGEAPSHPELLDNLAMEFVANGWDVKQMLKLIVTSSAYRQSSRTTPEKRQLDPLNQLFGRQSRSRLPAEMVRDAVLSISGLLDDSVGGRSVRPYQPTGYYQHLNFPARVYEPDQGSALWRRSVYVHWQRQYLHPMLRALDAPSREECTAKRQRSNTPLAALTLLNDPIFVEAARCFAERILQAELTNDAQRIDFACRQALSRPPEKNELALLTELLQESTDYYRQTPASAKELLAIGDAELNQTLSTADLAAWTTVARAVLNLAETSTRN